MLFEELENEEQNCNTLHLEKFNGSFQVQLYMHTKSRSCWRNRCLELDATWPSNLQSLANSRSGEVILDEGRSLMCIVKRRGPRMLP